MANHKSALKRARQNKDRYGRNKARKTAIKTLTKKIEAAVKDNQPETAEQSFLLAQKTIAKTGATSTMHKKTAARKISRLARLKNKLTPAS